MAASEQLAKWDRLKSWIAKRHDYFEREYMANNLKADAAELGAYRSVYLAMEDFEKKEHLESQQRIQKTRAPTRVPTPRA